MLVSGGVDKVAIHSISENAKKLKPVHVTKTKNSRLFIFFKTIRLINNPFIHKFQPLANNCLLEVLCRPLLGPRNRP
jgi:hypothetical protein